LAFSTYHRHYHTQNNNIECYECLTKIPCQKNECFSFEQYNFGPISGEPPQLAHRPTAGQWAPTVHWHTATFYLLFDK